MSTGVLSSEFKDLREEIDANMKKVAVSALGDEIEWEAQKYRVSFHPKPLVIDEREPVHPIELGK